MPPFSNKKKKIQLQLRQKRQQKRDRDDDPSAFYRSIMRKTHHRGKPIGQIDGSSVTKGGKNGPNSRAGGGRQERFADLQFFKDSDEEIRQRKEQAMNPIIPLEASHLEVDAISPLSSLDMPKRPAWDESMSKEQLDEQEQEYFRDFIATLLERSNSTDKKLSYFDLNLDTWRQLWRVLEMSEIITIIVDIRHPLFHFPPSLYEYIVNDLKKKVIIVLNKVDLVPASLVLAWLSYLSSQYPEAHIIPFASYAGMKTKASGKRVGLLHMAFDGARRFMLEVEKIVGPGNVDFTSWREKIQTDCNEEMDNDSADQVAHDDLIDDEDNEEAEKKLNAEALGDAQQIKTKHDTAYYNAEKYQDGILTIGCVGHPNVGKSSFMNALIGKKVVSVSRTPGHTKHFQTIFLTPNIRLCDCPGLVFPSYYPKQLQVLMGCYPISQLREPYSSIQYLAERVNIVEKLKLKPADDIRHRKPAMDDEDYTPVEIVDKREAEVVGCSDQWSAHSICESWATIRGFLTARSGRPDVYRAANHLLRMALDGRTLCMAFYPPGYLAERDSHWNNHDEISNINRIQGRHKMIDDGY